MHFGTLLFMLFGLLVYLALASVDFHAVMQAAGQLGIGGWAVLLSLSLVNYGLRFGRWHIYLRDLGHSVPLIRHLMIYLTGFALTATPGKVGEGIRALLLRQYGASIERSLSLLMAERLLDLMTISLLALLLFLAPVPEMRWFPVIGAAGVLLVLAACHPVSFTWLERLVRRLPSRKLSGLASRLPNFRHDLATLIRGRLLAGGLAIGLVAWLAEGIGLYLVALALDIPIGPAVAIGIYATAMLAGALSFLPGGLGSADATMTALLVIMGASLPAAAAATIIVRIATLWFAIALGGAAWPCSWHGFNRDNPKTGKDNDMARDDTFPAASGLASPASAPDGTLPLVVDLDGTLIKGDLLIEGMIALLKRAPLYLFLLPIWAIGGRAALKAKVAAHVEIDISALPVHPAFLAHLQSEKKQGRRLYLASGSHETWVRRAADAFGLFDGVFASDGTRNRTGMEKLSVLHQHFGPRGFDYAGNARADYPVWQAARRAIVVNASRKVTRWAQRHASVDHVFPPENHGFPTYLRAIRVHQWLKNLLLFVPLVAGFQSADMQAFGQIALGFLSFCCCASSVYLLNDIVDINDDRLHPRKCKRPFAAGELSIPEGLAAKFLLLAASAGLALFLPWQFGVTLAAYYATTLAYSLKLKQVSGLDVLVLAMLFTTRVIAGGTASGIPLSFWLLSFALFLFLCLAFVKRYAELAIMKDRNAAGSHGRGYLVTDLPMLSSMGIGAGYISAFVLGLYINSREVGLAYEHPQILWALVPIVLYWITRIWLLTHRGEMHDDPVVFAARDGTSLILVGLSFLAMVIAA